MKALTLIFVLSGAAGLIYESIWSRYLGLFVGHSAYAQVLVLVIFLGGMSVGAFIAGEFSTRLRRPLRAYAYVELVAGLVGLLFHAGFVWVSALTYDYLYPALAGTAGAGLAKWVLAALLILPQSILLGTTFPLMSAAAVRLFPQSPGRDLALLYFANSLGAAIGVLLAGFVLLRIGGLPGTLFTAATLNVFVCFAALAAERRLTQAAVPEEALAAMVNVEQPPSRLSARTRKRAAPLTPDVPFTLAEPAPALLPRLTLVLLAVSFGTAVASFIYEIAWIRMLSLVLGSATHAFELMLSAFILGLALGAFAIRKRVDRFKRPVLVLGWVQWFMGLFALATLPLYVASFYGAGAITDFFRSFSYGYEGYVVARYAVCLLIMLPATVLAGMTLPLITRTLLVAGAGERAIGRVYAVNTLGSITGVLLAAIILMPLLGLRLLLATGAIADMVIGALLLWPALRRWRLPRPRFAFAVLVAGAAFVGVTVAFVRLDRSLLTAGVFRYGTGGIRIDADVVFYRDGRTATVSVRRTTSTGRLTLATNGKPDASLERFWFMSLPPGVKIPLSRDNATQVLLPLVTLAHAPDARTAAVIGQGSGLSSHFLLGSPLLERVVTVEIEPEMINGSREFYPVNRRVFDDPRSLLVVDDAKSYFATGQYRFDMILSEPSNPWVSGVSGLFTVEFYQRVRRHLNEGGVLGQWLHLYEITDEMVLSVISALDAVFSDYYVYLVGPADILIVATPEGTLRAPDWGIMHHPGLREDFRQALAPTPDVFERLRVAGRSVLHPVVADVRANSDYYPVLDLAAERARYSRAQAEGIMELTRRWFDIPALLEGRRIGFATDTISATPGLARVDGAALSARLRSARATDSTPPSVRTRSSPAQRAFEAAVARAAALDAIAQSNQPPSDWRQWLIAVLTSEREMHFGTAGVSDPRFYSEMIAYARAQNAPADLIATMEFLHGMRAWDFEPVLRHSSRLEAAHREGTPWLSPDALRDGTVAAHLAARDSVRARERLEALTPLGDTTNAAYNFRTRILRGAVGLPPR